MKIIFERLNLIIDKINDQSFRRSKGLGNEIGYYIFDYEPKHEELVREHIVFLKNHFSATSAFKIKEFDLYEILIQILDSKGYLQKNFELEKTKGSEFVFSATRKTLRIATEEDLVIKYISDRVELNDVIFITGVGKSWPIIRSHTILNSLHNRLDNSPLIMFFPGTYDGQELKLFGEFQDDNYYRAFQLVEK